MHLTKSTQPLVVGMPLTFALYPQTFFGVQTLDVIFSVIKKENDNRL